MVSKCDAVGIQIRVRTPIPASQPQSEFTRKQKVGYLRSGSRVPVAAQTIGWQWVFLCLVPGPALGVVALRGLTKAE